MRCLACNVLLNDNEATRKYANTHTFIDLCDHCFSTVADDIPYIDGRGKQKDSEDYGTQTEEE